MDPDRRDFMRLAVGGLAAGAWLSPLGTQTAAPRKLKAIAFDGFPIFDPRPLFGLTETLFPGKGTS